jgi:hypothetical protein
MIAILLDACTQPLLLVLLLLLLLLLLRLSMMVFVIIQALVTLSDSRWFLFHTVHALFHHVTPLFTSSHELGALAPLSSVPVRTRACLTSTAQGGAGAEERHGRAREVQPSGQRHHSLPTERETPSPQQ